jgi:hypothetical protein
MRVRILAVASLLAALIALVVVYFVYFLESGPSPISAKANSDGSVNLTLQTVPSYGLHPFPDWVSYLAKNPQGKWIHTTLYKVPAHTLVRVTIYQYDTPTGLRNNFLAQIRGTIGGVEYLNGKPMSIVPPSAPAHTFTVPDLDISVPLPGVNPNAKNQCSVAPCTLAEAHNTITFSFRSPGPGTYRWQCFVPCAAGFLYGFGGPMQTIGYMDGLIEVA